MAERDRPHILVPGLATAERYRRPPQAFELKPRRIPANRRQHGQRLSNQLERAEADALARRDQETVNVEGAIDGIYVTFESFEGLEDAIQSLDPRGRGQRPQLRMVKTVLVDDRLVQQAVVFIPDGAVGYFLSRIEAYLISVDKPNPKNAGLIDRVDRIGVASLTELWTDSAPFPAGPDPVWWEVWLRKRDGAEVERLQRFAEATGASVGIEKLAFADRTVVLVRATAAQLSRALDVLDDVAELRRPREPASLIALQDASDQADWVGDLAGRTTPAPAGAPAVTVIDTGVHQRHPLLAPSLAPADCHACDPAWGEHDHDGHGTEMAGLALYGDLATAVVSAAPIRLHHRLESVKLLPPTGANEQHLWGALTATASSAVEVRAPQRKRAFGLAVTARRDPLDPTQANQLHLGEPTSWSAAVDALAAGLAIDTTEDGMVYLDEDEDREHRLFVVAAGNVRVWEDDYLARSDVEPIEDPGQAWNALTVGACTEIDTIDPSEGYRGWTPLAPRGELSPHSRTSVAFNKQWPIKPDVVLEGGNVARSQDGTNFDTPLSMQLLTTRAPLNSPRLLTVTSMTSAATAQASHLAASIIADYPAMWPETVRALIVHSAEWTDAMRSRVQAAGSRRETAALFRRYGTGRPDLARATRSATDALTLVAEDVIHPFADGVMREMNLHELPWPVEELSDLGGVEVRLRVTLSYFIDPNPARRGWRYRYRYASHGLRFDVRRPTESTVDFRKRINQLALAEDERRATTGSDAQQWCFGPDLRSAGSLHTDIWTGTAAELAQRGVIAVYPVTGWWKERPERDRSDQGARYSLIVSIDTLGQDVDIWTPVAAEVGVPIEIET